MEQVTISVYGRPISRETQIYHCEMTLLAMEKLQKTKAGDTRIYVDMDDHEVAIVSACLSKHLAELKGQ